MSASEVPVIQLAADCARHEAVQELLRRIPAARWHDQDHPARAGVGSSAVIIAVSARNRWAASNGLCGASAEQAGQHMVGKDGADRTRWRTEVAVTARGVVELQSWWQRRSSRTTVRVPSRPANPRVGRSVEAVDRPGDVAGDRPAQDTLGLDRAGVAGVSGCRSSGHPTQGCDVRIGVGQRETSLVAVAVLTCSSQSAAETVPGAALVRLPATTR
jgi:hypothetical protein